MPTPADGYPDSDLTVPVVSGDTDDYTGLSFSAAGGTSWPARIVTRLNLLSLIGVDLRTRMTAVEGATVPVWQDYTPHIYYESGTPGVYTEIVYGTSPVRDGWYRDDGSAVDFVQQVRLPNDAELGPDGRAICIGLPVEADTSLGNTFAVAINAQITFGVKVFDHDAANSSLHAGRLNDLDNGNFAFFVPDGGIAVTNTFDGITSDGNSSTGWHDFHVAGRYRKA